VIAGKLARNWKVIASCFLIGIISFVVGIALYEGEAFLVDGNVALEAQNLPWRISWPSFLIGVIFLLIGIALIVLDRD